MRLARLSSVFAAFALVLGCSGVISPKKPEPLADSPAEGNLPPPLAPGEAAPPVFKCDPSAVPPELGLPRLSRAQVEGTLRFAVKLGAPAEEATVWAAVSPIFARFPADAIVPAPGDLRGGYGRVDQAIQQTQVDALYDTAQAIATELTRTSARLGTLMGSCATDTSTSNDAACLSALVQKLGSRVLRYPLTADDVGFYVGIAGTTPVDPSAVADVIATLLDAPQTLYRVEHGTDDRQGVSPLSGPELAARLSLQLWQAPPDDALWAAGVDGTLLKPAVYQAQLERMLKSPAVNASVDELFTQWLRLRELPPLDALSNDPQFRAFAGSQLPGGGTRADFVGDVLASAHATLRTGGTLSDLLEDRHSYATDALLASIYGVPVWDGASEPPLWPSANRAGLLTRAGMLATGTALTRPIHKGYLVRNALLCQTVGAPPPNVNLMPPKASETQTTREAVSALTQNGVCSGCHTQTINPPGFITERFDALGRERTEERVFDPAGMLLASLPLDTAAIPRVSPGDTRSMSDAVQLTRVIEETQLFHSCFARHYFRFSQGRYEMPAVDGCLLRQLEDSARGGKLSDVFEAAAKAPSFLTKRFQ